MTRLSWIFFGIGLLMIPLAVAADYYFVVRPQSWPQTEAVVVSSRITNPTGPNSSEEELVLRYEWGGIPHTVTLRSGDGTYAQKRRHVDAMPPGRRLPVAVNPSNADDPKYEIGPTWHNLASTIALGLSCLFMWAIGFVAIAADRWISKPLKPQAAAPARGHDPMLGVAALVFGVLAVVLLGVGGLINRSYANRMRDWPQVNAEVLRSAVIATRTGNGNMFDVGVAFAYDVNGQHYVSRTMSGMSRSSRSDAQAIADAYASGTRHLIRHRPDDPNVINFDTDETITNFLLQRGGIPFLIGLGFVGATILCLWMRRLF